MEDMMMKNKSKNMRAVLAACVLTFGLIGGV